MMPPPRPGRQRRVAFGPEQVGVGAVVPEAAQDLDGAQAAGTKEQVGGEVVVINKDAEGFAPDAELADELREQLAADAPAPEIGVDGEPDDLDGVGVEMVDHEAGDVVPVLGDLADGVRLAQGADEVRFVPRLGIAAAVDGCHGPVIARDHPSHVQRIAIKHARPPTVRH